MKMSLKDLYVPGTLAVIFFHELKGLSHEIYLAFDDIYGLNRGRGHF
jgi:hypothetical protein